MGARHQQRWVSTSKAENSKASCLLHSLAGDIDEILENRVPTFSDAPEDLYRRVAPSGVEEKQTTR